MYIASHYFSKKVVVAIGLWCIVTIHHQTDSLACVQLIIKPSNIDVSSILCCVAGPILVEGLKHESDLPWDIPLCNPVVLMHSIDWTTWSMTIQVARIHSVENVLHCSISNSNNYVVVSPCCGPVWVKGKADLDDTVVIQLSRPSQWNFKQFLMYCPRAEVNGPVLNVCTVINVGSICADIVWSD